MSNFAPNLELFGGNLHLIAQDEEQLAPNGKQKTNIWGANYFWIYPNEEHFAHFEKHLLIALNKMLIIWSIVFAPYF